MQDRGCEEAVPGARITWCERRASFWGTSSLIYPSAPQLGILAKSLVQGVDKRVTHPGCPRRLSENPQGATEWRGRGWAEDHAAGSSSHLTLSRQLVPLWSAQALSTAGSGPPRSSTALGLAFHT